MVRVRESKRITLIFPAYAFLVFMVVLLGAVYLRAGA
jgi:hypothetical protein